MRFSPSHVKGVVIRIPVSGCLGISAPSASGVKVMSPDPDDEVVAIALVGDEVTAIPDQEGPPGGQ